MITYFEDDVDVAARLIEAEFQVDNRNSVDKRAALDPDRFGYLSLHYVATLSVNRQSLAEYRRFPALKAEIQVRSILQHAWAEIEHDLGYKSKAAIPPALRRRFSRLAGLLELADSEFRVIRDDLREHQTIVASAVASNSLQVGLDQAALKAFLESSDVLRDLTKRITRAVGAILEDVPADAAARYYVDALARVGIETIEDLNKRLVQHSDAIVAFATEWLAASGGSLDVSIPLPYLMYVLLGADGDIKRIVDVLEAQGIGDPSARGNLARNIVNTYARAKRAG